jgi:hypothetical protein
MRKYRYLKDLEPELLLLGAGVHLPELLLERVELLAASGGGGGGKAEGQERQETPHHVLQVPERQGKIQGPLVPYLVSLGASSFFSFYLRLLTEPEAESTYCLFQDWRANKKL